MSCCGTPRAVNPARPGAPGRWVLPRSPARSATCLHAFVYCNALGVAGGPVVKVCTGCGTTIRPAWIPDVVVRPALPAAPTSPLVGEAQWVEGCGVA